jgi:hypothetical protein
MVTEAPGFGNRNHPTRFRWLHGVRLRIIHWLR